MRNNLKESSNVGLWQKPGDREAELELYESLKAKIPGLVAVGVKRSKSDAAVVVYVERATKKVLKHMPEQWHDLPIRVVPVGKVRPASRE